MMPLELYSTESAYFLAKRHQGSLVEPTVSRGISVGSYSAVVLVTAAVALLWFLLDLVRKRLGWRKEIIVPRLTNNNNNQSGADSPKIRHLSHAGWESGSNININASDSTATTVVVGNTSKNSTVAGGTGATWKFNTPELPVLLFNSATVAQITKCFPGAIVCQDLVRNIKDALEPYGYGTKTTLLATSLCPEKVNRQLEKELAEVYEHRFAMGGLAGVPFGGVTAFGASTCVLLFCLSVGSSG